MDPGTGAVGGKTYTCCKLHVWPHNLVVVHVLAGLTADLQSLLDAAQILGQCVQRLEVCSESSQCSYILPSSPCVHARQLATM